MAANVRVGCQSWSYDDWVTKAGDDTVFYPRGTKPNEMLELYSRVFDTIEIDSTAYGPPTEGTIRGWYDKTPPDFIFSLKTPRRITHDFPLEPAIYPEMDEFLAQAAGLKEKLGAILIQFPAAFEATRENGAKLRAFLTRLPAQMQFAVEFRDPGWFVDWMYEELGERSIPVALVDGKWVDRELMFAGLAKLPARFAYVRLMGVRDLEKFDRVQRPQDVLIELWSQKLGTLGVENLYIYADNYFEGLAPATANKVKASLKIPVVSPETLQEQPSLF